MKTNYLIRLDDACPTMDKAKWQRMENILDNFGVKPLVGVIPNNEDPKQKLDAPDNNFWDKVHHLEQKGWIIALHGYDHCYITEGGMRGLNPMWKRSEFACVSLKQQRDKIRKGVAIMREHGINPRYFFAPSHTFDENTLTALRQESDIRVISDTIATRPYRYKDFVFIPQVGGHCTEIKIPGVWTFCLHPSTMNESNFAATDNFLKAHKKQFVNFNDLELSNLKSKDLFSRFLSWLYFTKRRIKGKA